MTAHRTGDRSVVMFALALAAAGGLACKKSQPDRPSGLPASGFSAGTPATATPPSTPPPSPSTPPASDDETVPAAPDPKTTIVGTITVPAAQRKLLAPSDVVFIIARRSGGPPGMGSMMAVQKHPLGQFPMPFTLSARDSMIPGRHFEGRMDITVRIDKDGDGMTRKKGDLFGQANNISVGTQDLAISVDGVQAEDQTLTMPATAGGGGGRPPGHP
jgi:hypothetical protein